MNTSLAYNKYYIEIITSTAFPYISDETDPAVADEFGTLSVDVSFIMIFDIGISRHLVAIW